MTGKSITREAKKLIHNSNIRKNVSSIYIGYDWDVDDDVITINFKENTMVNIYDNEIANSTGIQVGGCKMEDVINGWLAEVYVPLVEFSADEQEYLLSRA